MVYMIMFICHHVIGHISAPNERRQLYQTSINNALNNFITVMCAEKKIRLEGAGFSLRHHLDNAHML